MPPTPACACWCWTFRPKTPPPATAPPATSTPPTGRPLRDLVGGRSEAFRRRFCLTHFFTPPRYLKLVEIVGGADTSAETLAKAEDLCGRVLGKGLVRAKDTPNFIANRIGVFAMLRT